MNRAIGIVIHPGFQILDVAGPTGAFEIASRFSEIGYDVRLMAPSAGRIISSATIALEAADLSSEGIDTIIVAGGELVRDLEAFDELVEWLATVRPRRLASVCSGAFLLAEAERLDGRLATTHWESTERFRRSYPKVMLEADRIFTRDGDVWTSAGITAGIDLALALIEDDLGPDIARRTAQQLVVHKRRLGGQSQFSGLLELGGNSTRFAPLLEWIKDNLTEPLTIERLADQAAMSPRNFARLFVKEIGMTPARAVERLRTQAAKDAVESSSVSFQQIAQSCGFHDAGQMRRAFVRVLGAAPQIIRKTAGPPGRA